MTDWDLVEWEEEEEDLAMWDLEDDSAMARD